MRLQDKVIIVTGAGSEMGLAMANRFAREGATLMAADWNGPRRDAAVAAIPRRHRQRGTVPGL